MKNKNSKKALRVVKKMRNKDIWKTVNVLVLFLVTILLAISIAAQTMA
jgi:hypothetical protein